jgi:hypothetical protein
MVCHTEREFLAACAHASQLRKIKGQWVIVRAGDYSITNYVVGHEGESSTRRNRSGWTLTLARPRAVTAKISSQRKEAAQYEIETENK